MNDLEIAYLAGLIDGEGSFQFRQASNGKMYPRLVIKMNSGNWEPLVEKLGIGHLYRNQSIYNEQSAWYLYNRKDLITFIQMILPYLRVKREVAQDMLTTLIQWK